MSLIAQFECSNLLNSTKSDVWTPSIPSIKLTLDGLNTAIFMGNGAGKTTLSRCMLGTLSRHTTLVTAMKEAFAPRVQGIYTHVRVEFVQPRQSTPSPTLPGIVNKADGDRYVFGVCGYSDSTIKFYCYSGRLEDVPVVVKDNSGELTFILNEEFESNLRSVPSYKWNVSAEDWKERVQEHWGQQQLRQMVQFLLQGGDDKSASLYQTPSVKGELFDETFFYTHIAPYLTVGSFYSSPDEKDEPFLEGKILTHSISIIEAQHEGEKKVASIVRQKEVGLIFGKIKNHYENIEAAKVTLNKAQEKICETANSIKHLITDFPLPGIPKTSDTDSEKLNELVQNIVIVPNSDQPFLLKDKGLALLLNKQAKGINETADRNRIQSSKEAQVIDITCDQKLENLESRGRNGRFYSLTEALNFIDTVNSEYMSTDKGTSVDKTPFKNLVREAFSVFKKYCDTSPLRLQLNQKIALLARLDQDIKTSKNELRKNLDQKVALEERLQTLKSDKNAYDEMVATGLFSEEELQDPLGTKSELQKLHDHHFEQFSKNNSEVSRLQERYDLSQEFYREHPGDLPQPHFDEITKEETRLNDLASKTEVEFEKVSKKAKDSRILLKEKQKDLQVATDAFVQINAVHSDHTTTVDAFPEEDIIGFQARVRKRGTSFAASIGKLQGDLEHANKDYQYEVDFYAKFGDINPAEWLDEIDNERATLTIAAKENDLRIEQVKEDLESLKRKQVAPGRHARHALNLIPAEVAYESLHSFIKSNYSTNAEELLSLFSSFLFAPVIQNAEDIKQVLSIYNSQEVDILLPVFHQDTLESFLAKNQEERLVQTDLVCYVFSGQKTNIIEYILDPENTVPRKEKLTQEYQDLVKRCEKYLARLAEIKVSSPDISLATRAKHSKTQNLSFRTTRLAKEIDKETAAYDTHKIRYSDTVLKTIENAELFLQLGGPEKFGHLHEQKAVVKKAVEKLSLENEDLEEQRSELSTRRNEYVKTAREYESEHVGIKAKLKNLIDFLPDGPEEYLKVQKLLAEHKACLEILKRKQAMEFGRADSYVETIKITNETELKKAFDEINAQIKIAENQIKGFSDKRPMLEESIRKVGKESEKYDRFLSSMADLYKKLAKTIYTLPDNFENRLIPLIEGSALRFAEELTNVNLSAKIDDLMAEVTESFEDRNIDLLKTKASSALKAFQKTQKDFENLCDEEYGKSERSSVLNASEKELIVEVKNDPSRLAIYYENIQRILTKAEDDYKKGKDDEERLKQALAGNLAKLTANAGRNLKTLKRVMNESDGGATFAVQAAIASREEIESSLDNLVTYINTIHSRYLVKQNDPYSEWGKADEKKHHTDLRSKISEKCYRSIFRNTSIKFIHPHIRGGNATRFDLTDKGRLSGGEKSSLSLMMQVRMAQYSHKRKLLEDRALGARRKQNASEGQNILWIDGLFSNLSKLSLIEEAFRCIKATHGSFQIIGLIHNSSYVDTHDFDVFPNLFVGRTYINPSHSSTSEGWTVLEKQDRFKLKTLGFGAVKVKKSLTV